MSGHGAVHVWVWSLSGVGSTLPRCTAHHAPRTGVAEAASCVLSSLSAVLLHAWRMRAGCASRAWYVYGAWCVHGACISASIGANRTCAAAHAHALSKRDSGAQSLCAGAAFMCEEVGAGDVV